MSSQPAYDFINRYFKSDVAARGKLNFTPSENVLSPLARLPFVLDAHSRYFLDDQRIFGYWAFPAGEALGDFEQNFLMPLLNDLAGSTYSNVRAVSGINCMTLALAAWTKPGDTILSVPMSAGGHPSTEAVAARLGLKVQYIPFTNCFDADLDAFAALVKKERPTFIYIDQGSMLFPLDPQPLRAALKAVQSDAIIHYDSSHINGLILGGAMFNPLERGADSFGGSTHKTLPGPHKGFISTNSEAMANAYTDAADHFVSQHNMASVMSLAFTLYETKYFGGARYAADVVSNTKLLARLLDEKGVFVFAKERGFTDCHQLWLHYNNKEATEAAYGRLAPCGLNINKFDGLPGIDQAVFRFSVAEFTKKGATADNIQALADVLVNAARQDYADEKLQADVAAIKKSLHGIGYCVPKSEIGSLMLADDVRVILERLYEL